MEATQESQEFALLHLEWWDGRSGAQVVVDALRAAGLEHAGVHVYTPEWLTVEPTPELGEAEIWISVPVMAEPDHRTFRGTLDAVRTVVRVKTAALIPADKAHLASARVTAVWDWLDGAWRE